MLQTVRQTASDPTQTLVFNYASEALNNSFFLSTLVRFCPSASPEAHTKPTFCRPPTQPPSSPPPNPLSTRTTPSRKPSAARPSSRSPPSSPTSPRTSPDCTPPRARTSGSSSKATASES